MTDANRSPVRDDRVDDHGNTHVMVGGDDGFDAFFRHEYPKLLALGRALAPMVAHDLAQEALIRACREWTTVSGYDIPGAWVRRVMLRLVADHYRAGRRRDRAIERLRVLQRAERGNHEITAADDAWFDMVRALPRRQREVVALHYIDQMPIAEVAAVLEIAPGTVKASQTTTHPPTRTLQASLRSASLSAPCGPALRVVARVYKQGSEAGR